MFDYKGVCILCFMPLRIRVFLNHVTSCYIDPFDGEYNQHNENTIGFNGIMNGNEWDSMIKQ